MRISGGEYRGRTLAVPRSGLRPTSDKVRQALYNILGPVDGWWVLDLYAGSGAVGFEALSRGARSLCCVESDRRAVPVIRQNARLFGCEIEIYARPVEAYLREAPPGVFDLVFLDPPYQDEAEKTMLSGSGIARCLKPGGVLVYESSTRENPPVIPGLEAGSVRKYGETALHFFSAPGNACESGRDMV